MKRKLRVWRPRSRLWREGERVKIHYIGYGGDEDEWREANELVQFSKKPQPYILFELHRELTYQIQAALDSKYFSFTSDPFVYVCEFMIVLPFSLP